MQARRGRMLYFQLASHTALASQHAVLLELETLLSCEPSALPSLVSHAEYLPAAFCADVAEKRGAQSL
eukprot:1827764-Pleurochrysis_carterae.AAC.2